MPRRRPLRPDEEDLWQAVARTATPLHPATRKPQPNPQAVTQPAAQAASSGKVHGQFRIGEKVTTAARHDLAVPLSDRLAAAPLRMDAKAFARMSRGKLLPDARIDLHGLTLAEAHPELIRFVLGAHGRGLRLVLVITGKGRKGRDDDPVPQRTGALKHQVPTWLHQPPLAPVVLQVAEAHMRHGGAGAYYVYLRRTRGS